MFPMPLVSGTLDWCAADDEWCASGGRCNPLSSLQAVRCNLMLSDGMYSFSFYVQNDAWLDLMVQYSRPSSMLALLYNLMTSCCSSIVQIGSTVHWAEGYVVLRMGLELGDCASCLAGENHDYGHIHDRIRRHNGGMSCCAAAP